MTLRDKEQSAISQLREMFPDLSPKDARVTLEATDWDADLAVSLVYPEAADRSVADQDTDGMLYVFLEAYGMLRRVFEGFGSGFGTLDAPDGDSDEENRVPHISQHYTTNQLKDMSMVLTQSQIMIWLS